jgi:intramembrane prenyl-peptidase
MARAGSKCGPATAGQVTLAAVAHMSATSDSETAAAPLSLRDAHLINAVLTLGYVLPLYFTKFTRLSFSKTPENNGTRSKGASERWRDDPAVIKARLLSVSLSTVASLFLMGYIIATRPSKSLEVSKRLFELGHVLLKTIQSRWDIAALHLGFSLGKFDLLAYFVTPALFLGPLYGRYLSRDLPFVAHGTFNQRKNILDWVGIRNYIVVSAGPTNPYESHNHVYAYSGTHI